LWLSGNHKEDRYPPSYYIEWAKSKRLEIKWYSWAVKNEYLSEELGPALQDVVTIEKEITPRERNTLILLIAALCQKAGIDHRSRTAAGEIEGLTDLLGAKVTDETVRKYLDKIPGILATRGN